MASAAKPPTLADKLPELRRPFAVAAIKAKPQKVSERQDGTQAGLVTYYIDARLVAERLNEVVGPENWTDDYRMLSEGRDAPALGIPVECRLTVLGVTKTDVGQIAPGAVDDKAWKSAYSDAFKRAAVKFGVGGFLYGLPNVWADLKIGKNGKAQGFSDSGTVALRAAYAKWLKDVGIAHFGDPLDHGPEPEPATAPEEVDAPDAPKFPLPKPKNGSLTPEQEEELAALTQRLIEGKHITQAQINAAQKDEHPRGLLERLQRFEKNVKATA